jgi:hypothetical protein
MNNNFSAILNKCKTPTFAILKEALIARNELSDAENSFITYIAGFSHFEFAEKLLDEFGLVSLYDRLIIFDNLQKKFHFKILINDLIDLSCLNTMQTSNNGDDNSSFTSKTSFVINTINWRNKDGSYINNIREEIRHLSFCDYKKYCETHMMGILEHVYSWEISHENINFSFHFVNVPRNIDINFSSLLSGVSNVFFANGYDKMPNLSVCNLRKKSDIYHLLSAIKWGILERENYLEAKTFLDEINASYTLIPDRGEEYNYFDEFVSSTIALYAPKIKLLNLI